MLSNDLKSPACEIARQYDFVHRFKKTRSESDVKMISRVNYRAGYVVERLSLDSAFSAAPRDSSIPAPQQRCREA
jgi:hypothetical protein